jgi:nucleoid-associated protein EbfC
MKGGPMGGGGGMGDIMRQAQKMQKDLLQAQEGLKEKIVQGSSGGGMVVATMNGQRQLVAVKLDKEVVNPGDIEMLEDLIVAAISDAAKKAEKLQQDEMGKITGGLPIPGMF